MSDSSDKCVIVCESVHDVMALERALKDEGISVEMVPTPRELSSDCGMALEVIQTEIGRIAELHAQRPFKWRGLFAKGSEGFSKLL